MKKILCISDSHGNIAGIQNLLDKMNECDYIFHLGDHYYDINLFLKEYDTKIYTVFGNCDGGGEDYQIIIDGVKILLTHGDKYHVKSSLLRLSIRAQELGVNLVLYGHTHNAKIDEYNGITFVNPGALSRFGGKSYCIIEIENGKFSTRIENL